MTRTVEQKIQARMRRILAYKRLSPRLFKWLLLVLLVLNIILLAAIKGVL